MQGLGGGNQDFRGATLQFATFFYDFDGTTIVTPSSATVNIVYQDQSGQAQTDSVPMTPPVDPSQRWTALWDTRGKDPGAVSWSIHTSGTTVAVEDGQVTLTANPANLVTFP